MQKKSYFKVKFEKYKIKLIDCYEIHTAYYIQMIINTAKNNAET